MTTPHHRTRIFISYRREDSAGSAGRLNDALANRVSPNGVYFDVVAAKPGTDFARRIRAALEEARIVLVVIGPEWLTVTGEDGRRRLDSPDDHVRSEIRAALERNLVVIPVLVDDASMPTADQLPRDLRKLATIEAVYLTHRTWQRDLDGLLDTLAGEVTLMHMRVPSWGQPGSLPAQPQPTTRVPHPDQVPPTRQVPPAHQAPYRSPQAPPGSWVPPQPPWQGAQPPPPPPAQTGWGTPQGYQPPPVQTNFTPDRIQRQVREQAGVNTPAQGGGTLFTEPILVVNQKAKLIELTNEYAVFDQHGNQLGSVVEVGQSGMKKALRLLSSLDQYMTHRLEVRDQAGRVWLALTRPAKFVKSRVVVARPDGVEIGTIVQQNVFGKIRFDIQVQGTSVGMIKAENWRAWNFSIVDHTDGEVARITKTWEGLAKTMFTTADNYVLQIHRPLADPLRSMVVASALTIDTALKQDARGFG